MPSKEPLAHLDELIGKAAEKLSALRAENLQLAGKLREAEAEAERLRGDLQARGEEQERLEGATKRLEAMEAERADVETRIREAARRLRGVLAGAPAPASDPSEGKPTSDDASSGGSEVPGEDPTAESAPISPAEEA